MSASDRCQGFHSPVGVGDGIGKAVGVVATNRCVRRGDPGHGPRPCGQVNDRVQPGLGLGRQRRGGVDLSRRCSNAGDLGEKQDPAVSVAESPDNSLGHRRVYRRLPDFLGPLPTGRIIGFDEGLAQIAATSLDVVQQELTHLAEHRVAQQGPHRAERQALMRRLLEDPEQALHIIVTELEQYWERAIQPHWPRIHRLLQDDLAFRLEELATGGVERLFRTLHPSVAFRGELLTVVKYYRGRVALRGRGLLLVPSAFAWPDVLVSTADPLPSLTYGPRGLGTLWETGNPSGAEAPLAAVVGSARATILALLDLPMTTTQLASHLDARASTVNVHLRALDRAGIVTARRDGRMVFYRRTSLGDQLVTERQAGDFQHRTSS